MKIKRVLVLLRHDFPLLWIVVPFVCGQQLACLQAMHLGIASGLLLVLLIGRYFYTNNIIRLLYYIVLGCVAATWSNSRVTILEEGEHVIADVYQIQGEVIDVLRYPKTNLVKFGLLVDHSRTRLKGDLGILKGEDTLHDQRLYCQAVYLPWRNAAKIAPGNSVTVHASLLPASKLPAWYREYLRMRGYVGLCKIKLLAITDKRIDWLYGFRKQVRERIYQVLGRNENVGLLLAMTIGSRDQISNYTEQSFKYTGLMHLLVLSGFQLTLVYATVVHITRWLMVKIFSLWRFCNTNLIASIAGLLCVGLLLIIAGLEHSSTRAAICLLLVSIANYNEYKVNLLNSVLGSFLLLTVCYPQCVFDLGVQLTYASLLAILVSDAKNISLRSYLVCSFWCGIFTGLILLIRGQGLSIGSFIFNPLFAGIFSFIGTQLGLLAIIFCLLKIDGGYFGRLIVLILEYLKYVIWYLSDYEWIYYDGSDPLVTSLLVCLFFILVVRQGYSCVTKYLNKYGYG
jgi:ComEC/Rec2-related protein